jgi:hypothetical protein
MATTDVARIDLARRALNEAHRAVGLVRRPIDSRERLVSTGIVSLDEALGGGLARGSLYTLLGEPSSGRISLALEWLTRASLSAREPVAFIDGADALDPDSVAAVLRPRMLWVRARSMLEALACGEQVLDAGGFAMVCLYLVGAARAHPSSGQRLVGPGHWARIVQRAQATTTLALAVCDADEPCAPGPFARASIVAARAEPHWDRGSVLDGMDVSVSLTRHRRGALVTHARAQRVTLRVP